MLTPCASSWNSEFVTFTFELSRISIADWSSPGLLFSEPWKLMLSNEMFFELLTWVFQTVDGLL